ncbi:hypothetical protein C9374_004065 [Naegleria lovaniensis]|uniref:Transmembrane protein 131-like N-terminal domain-containing protein n=1 Tax=Naegleria lovaniensis TaxID=51637 RepID=A0AA88GQN3_NAELO|nr:uncharacterized protein C9374_004065 [Naegleria lovaniensis]KAG2383394.1 hypothetical protein C9374_004065 [Naegleria lovaniensis]
MVPNTCNAMTTVAHQMLKMKQQQEHHQNNNNHHPIHAHNVVIEDKNSHEFTYIKNSAAHAQDKAEFSNILINDQDFASGNSRRTYLQQLKDKFVNTHKGNLHFDIKLDDEEEDDEDDEDHNKNDSSSSNINIIASEMMTTDLEQQKHAQTDEDFGEDDDNMHLETISVTLNRNPSLTNGDNVHNNDDTNNNVGPSSTSSSSTSSSKSNAGMLNSGSAASTSGSSIESSTYMTENTKVKLIFDPPMLDYEDRPLCNPIAKTFTITKEAADDDSQQPLQVTANAKTIRRVNNCSYKLWFLCLQAYGGGIENAYNIKPILGYKLPVGADYRKPIYMHNPHQNETLLIKEIYTSEDFLLLSLPDQNSNEKNLQKKNLLLSLWKLEPQQTKSIILLNFHATQPKTHTGFVHINTNRGQFIIPVEFVVSKNGVHRVAEEIDFGTFITLNEKRTRDVVLLNSSPHPVMVYEASVSSPDTTNLKLEFQKNIMQEGSIVAVAKLVLTSQSQGDISGKIIFKTNDTNSDNMGIIEVPYRARNVIGTLDYRMNNTAFYTGDGKEKTHEMVLINGFQLPIKFISCDIFDKQFTIEDFVQGAILQPNEKKKILSIRYSPGENDAAVRKTNLILHTNVTRLYIPLYTYHGNLDHLPIDTEKNILDADRANEGINLGILSLSSRKIHYFAISNTNPVPIKITDWKVMGMANKKSSISISYVKSFHPSDELRSLPTFKPTKLSDSINNKHLEGAKDSFIFAILPNQKVIMKIDIYTPTSDEEQNGYIEFVTQTKNLVIPLKFLCMEGSLSFTNQLPFDPTFPGKIQKKNIYATNTFGRAITITGFKSNDERFIPHITHKTIEANQKMNIGYVILDASKVPKEKNYMLDDGKMYSNNYSKKISSISSEEFTKYRWRNGLFDEIKNAGQTNVIASVSIDTDIGINCNINVSTTLEYPKLSPTRQISFKLTHIGSSVSQYLTVENPSDQFISLQLILGNGSLAKFLQRNAKGTLPKNDIQGDKSYTEFRLPKDGMTSANIPPHRHASLGPIIFTPKSDSTESVAYLYIRNNLTIFDIVKLSGIGGSSKLVFSGENGNDLTSLKFEIKESQLGTWDNYTNRFVQNNYSSSNGSDETSKTTTELVFHKKFTLQNKGNMPITILSSSIENMGCSAYGVKIHKCGRFDLQPGQSTSFKISYKPDFTTAVVDLFIRFNTDQGKMSFPIRFTLPYNVLPYFYETQPLSTGHRLFRVAATFIVLTLAVYIIFRACRELKTLDSTDNELPSSISEFLKPNFSSFPFITFPSTDVEKQQVNTSGGTNAINKDGDDHEKTSTEDDSNRKKKTEKKKKQATTSSTTQKTPTASFSKTLEKSNVSSSKKPKPTKTTSTSMNHSSSEDDENKLVEVVTSDFIEVQGKSSTMTHEQEHPMQSTLARENSEQSSQTSSTSVSTTSNAGNSSSTSMVQHSKKQPYSDDKNITNTYGSTNVAYQDHTAAEDMSHSSSSSSYESKGTTHKPQFITKKYQQDGNTTATTSKKQPFDKKQQIKKKFNENEPLIIKPKTFVAVPNNTSSGNEKPKFYAVKPASHSMNGGVDHGNTDMAALSTSNTRNYESTTNPLSGSRSRTPNSNEMARFTRESPLMKTPEPVVTSANNHIGSQQQHLKNPQQSNISPSLDNLLNQATRERSTSDSATYKPLTLNTVASSISEPQTMTSSSNLDEKSTTTTGSVTSDDQALYGSIGSNLSGLLNDNCSTPSPATNNVTTDFTNDLLRSVSVSPPPLNQPSAIPSHHPPREQVGVIGNNARKDQHSNPLQVGGIGSSQPYWFFGSTQPHHHGLTSNTSNMIPQANTSLFGSSPYSPHNGFIGSPNPQPSNTTNMTTTPFGMTNPLINPTLSYNNAMNRMAFQQSRPAYFSLFDSRPLFSPTDHNSFFSLSNTPPHQQHLQRSQSSSPSHSDGSGNAEYGSIGMQQHQHGHSGASSLFSYGFPYEDQDK